MSFVDNFSNYADTLSYPGVRLPNFQFDQEDLDEWGIKETNPDEILKILCRNGYKKFKIDEKDNKDKYVERVKYELDTVIKLGFSQYFLIVYGIINYCKKNDIPYSPTGRGSCVSSLIMYLLELTGIDPIEYGLFFERFINETRSKYVEIDGVKYFDGKNICDVDIDISHQKRGQLINDYLNVKFKNKTSKILTITTLASRVCFKEVAKTFGEYQESDIISISSSFESIYGKTASISDSLNGNEKDGIKQNQVLINFEKDNKELVEIALKLEDLAKNFGCHPSGYLLSNSNLDEEIPYQLSESGEIISSFEMGDSLSRLLKVDLLGLRTVDLVYNVSKEIGIDLKDINKDDAEIYQLLQKEFAPYGLFQFGIGMAHTVLTKIKPRNFEELAACTSLARPSSIQFIDDYNKREINPIHPLFDEVLKPTFSTVLFQEQTLQLLTNIGFSKVEAENARRGIGKKDEKEIEKAKDLIYTKIKERGIDEKMADWLWKVVKDSAGYGFNACLSPDTIVDTKDGYKMMHECSVGEEILAYDIQNDKNHYVKINNVFENNKELYEVELEDGRKICASLEHKFLCEDKIMRPLQEIILKKLKILTD